MKYEDKRQDFYAMKKRFSKAINKLKAKDKKPSVDKKDKKDK